MKKIFLILGFVLSFVLGYAVKPSHSEELKDMKSTVDKARTASVELNRQFNEMYNKFGYAALNNNKFGGVGLQIMQVLSPNIMSVNKALGLDCKKYDENGKPVMVKEKTGETSPIEILPEEIRIEE